MGHDVHFLSRLERLGDHRQLDLALGLYRDPRAVRIILEAADLPDDTDRIALALSDGAESPHLIVTRNGRFVTCLGAGMRVNAPRVVSRTQIDHALDHSAAIGRADARIRWRGGVDELMKRVLLAGMRLAREDFEAMWLLAPVFAFEFNALLKDSVEDLIAFTQSITLRMLRRTDRATEKLLRDYGIATARVDHLVLLTIPSALQVLAIDTSAPVAGAAIAMLGTAEISTALRVANYAAHVGPHALPQFAKLWREAGSLHDALCSLPALIGIAARHPDARAETEAILAERAAPVFAVHTHGAVLDHVCRETSGVLDDIEGTEAQVRSHLRAQLAPHGFTDLSDAIVDGILGTSTASLLRSFEWLCELPRQAVWAARREPVDFFVPAAQVDRFVRSVNTTRVRDRLRVFVEYFGRDQPIRRAPQAGRNDACPCGSGRKFKRCCLNAGDDAG